MNDKEVIKMLRTIEETVYLGNLKFYEAIDAAIKALEQPTVEPERKKGKWIEYNATGKKQWMCSECCAEEKNPKVARFCYWCGADMRGDNE
jgi:hypothetical protein